MTERERFACCDPYSEWCRRSSLYCACTHATARAQITGWRHYVYRSKPHEVTGNREFWMISTHRRDGSLVRQQVG